MIRKFSIEMMKQAAWGCETLCSLHFHLCEDFVTCSNVNFCVTRQENELKGVTLQQKNKTTI